MCTSVRRRVICLLCFSCLAEIDKVGYDSWVITIKLLDPVYLNTMLSVLFFMLKDGASVYLGIKSTIYALQTIIIFFFLLFIEPFGRGREKPVAFERLCF